MRFVFVCFAALLLAGCANSSLGSLGGSSTVARPKTIVVTDFAFGPDVTAVDRAYTARLERKIGSFPTHERKPRTLERVNEEIVATIVTTLRGAGLQAQPGGEDSGGEGAVLVSGEIKATEAVVNDVKRPKPVTEQIGFGAGRSNFAADVKVLSGGKRQLASFTVDAGGGRGAPAGNAKQAAAAQNAAIATALAEQNAAPEKLSPDTEGQARRIGRNAAEKILAYAKEQGWLAAPAEVAEAKQ
ncbi:MAG TPA: hypothetical protein VGM57_02460 [Pseudolabrys sp.]